MQTNVIASSPSPLAEGYNRAVWLKTRELTHTGHSLRSGIASGSDLSDSNAPQDAS